MVENLTLGFYADTVSRALELRPDVQRFLQSRSHNPDEADDLVQDTYLKLLEAQEQFDPGRGSLKGWLMRIAHNVYVDHVRRNARRPVVQLKEDEVLTYMGTSLVEQKIDAEVKLKSLSDEEREVLGHFSAGYSTEEIARETGMPRGTVKSRLFRGRAKLEQAL